MTFVVQWIGHHMQDKLMIPVLSCKIDMTQWLKNKFKGSGHQDQEGAQENQTILKVCFD